MEIIFGVFGALFVVAGVRKQSSNLYSLIKSDFTGSPNYFEWAIVIFLVGAIGYIDDLKTMSRLFMALIFVDLLYKNPNVFKQFTTQETQGAVPSNLSGSGGLPSLQQLVPGLDSQSTSALPTLPSLAQTAPVLGTIE